MTEVVLTVSPFLFGDPLRPIPFLGGTCSLDVTTAPHVSGTLVTTSAVKALVDPRDNVRVVLDIAAVSEGGVQTRRLDLGVRSVSESARDAQVTLRLESDEALLADYRPLTDDDSPAGTYSIRQLVNLVLQRVLPGAQLGPGGDKPLPDDRSAESMLWPAGVSALDFLVPHVQTAGMRLVCDEARYWTLRTASYSGRTGDVSFAYGVDLIDGDSGISRDEDVWYDGAVVRYQWRDAAGVQHEAVDSFSVVESPTKVALFERTTPFPGTGFAEYLVRRAQNMGREITGTRIADWTAQADHFARYTLDGADEQIGTVRRVEFDLERGEMTVTSQVFDVTDDAWISLPAGEAWQDSPVEATWIEEKPE